MSCGNACQWCDYADNNRKNGGHIRCKRFSQWVLSSYACAEYTHAPKYEEILASYVQNLERQKGKSGRRA